MKHYIQLGVKLLNFQRRIGIKFSFTGELLCSLPDKCCQSSIKPPWGLIPSTFEGGGGEGGGSLTERGRFFLNIVKVMIIREELECKVENLRYLKLGVLQPMIKNRFKIPASE